MVIRIKQNRNAFTEQIKILFNSPQNQQTRFAFRTTKYYSKRATVKSKANIYIQSLIRNNAAQLIITKTLEC